MFAVVLLPILQICTKSGYKTEKGALLGVAVAVPFTADRWNRMGLNCVS